MSNLKIEQEIQQYDSRQVDTKITLGTDDYDNSVCNLSVDSPEFSFTKKVDKFKLIEFLKHLEK